MKLYSDLSEKLTIKSFRPKEKVRSLCNGTKAVIRSVGRSVGFSSFFFLEMNLYHIIDTNATQLYFFLSVVVVSNRVFLLFCEYYMG